MEGATRTGQSGTTHFFLAGCEIRMGAPLSWAPKYEVLPRKAQGIIVSGVATEGKLWDRREASDCGNDAGGIGEALLVHFPLFPG